MSIVTTPEKIATALRDVGFFAAAIGFTFSSAPSSVLGGVPYWAFLALVGASMMTSLGFWIAGRFFGLWRVKLDASGVKINQ